MCPSIELSKTGGHPDGCRHNEFFEGPAALHSRVG